MNLEDALKVSLEVYTEATIDGHAETIFAHHGNQCTSNVACDLQHQNVTLR